MKRLHHLLPLLPLLALAARAEAQAVAYTDETAFLNALAAMGTPVLQEGFEDDAVWGGVRSTISGGFVTAPSVTSQGVTWVPSSPNNGITTGNGAAVTGQWGLYSYPHGDYLNGIGDGFGGSGGAQLLMAVGGWIRTNTPPAKIGLELDGVAVDFGGLSALSGPARFFGAIDPTGFDGFLFLELEGVLLDQKLIFSDDFSFAFGGTLIDCNQNGVSDGLDISNGASADCNGNLIPDECEIDAQSGAPGGPFFCTSGCAEDCNDNGVLDECEVVVPILHSSGQLGPIGNGFPQSFAILQPAPTLADVILDFTAAAKLDGPEGYLAVDVNGVPVGSVFDLAGSDCPEGAADIDRLVVPSALFNAALNGGDAIVTLVAGPEVGAFDCNAPTWASVNVTLFVASAADLNENGIPDECESAVAYCTAGSSASGCHAALSAAGQASASAASGFVLSAAGVEGQKDGLFFFGSGGRQANPWGNGTSYQCVIPPVTRAGLLVGTGTTGACDGSFAQDLNAVWCPTCPKPAQNPGAGATAQAQLWYRDPQNTSNQTTSLSNALEFPLAP